MRSIRESSIEENSAIGQKLRAFRLARDCRAALQRAAQVAAARGQTEEERLARQDELYDAHIAERDASQSVEFMEQYSRKQEAREQRALHEQRELVACEQNALREQSALQAAQENEPAEEARITQERADTERHTAPATLQHK